MRSLRPPTVTVERAGKEQTPVSHRLHRPIPSCILSLIPQQEIRMKERREFFDAKSPTGIRVYQLSENEKGAGLIDPDQPC